MRHTHTKGRWTDTSGQPDEPYPDKPIHHRPSSSSPTRQTIRLWTSPRQCSHNNPFAANTAMPAKNQAKRKDTAKDVGGENYHGHVQTYTYPPLIRGTGPFLFSFFLEEGASEDRGNRSKPLIFPPPWGLYSFRCPVPCALTLSFCSLTIYFPYEG